MNDGLVPEVGVQGRHEDALREGSESGHNPLRPGFRVDSYRSFRLFSEETESLAEV